MLLLGIVQLTCARGVFNEKVRADVTVDSQLVMAHTVSNATPGVGHSVLTPCCALAQELSQRALVSYLRSVFLQPNRAVFDVAALPVRTVAHAWNVIWYPSNDDSALTCVPEEYGC